MKGNKSAPEISSLLRLHYPGSKCSLVFANPFECLVSVMLSAQCTDEKVNKVTPSLFSAYPDPASMSKAPLEDIEAKIHSLGLYKNKAKNLKEASRVLSSLYQGNVPNDYEALVSLPGVGNKTARVVLMESFGAPSFPVDTHVGRVSSRLSLTKEEDSPESKEAKLERLFDKREQALLHHCFIDFGRDICHSQNPECDRCFLREFCRYFSVKNKDLRTGK